VRERARAQGSQKAFGGAILTSLLISLIHSMVQPQEYNLFFLTTLVLALAWRPHHQPGGMHTERPGLSCA
jgi:hypothetical protein